MKKLFVLTAIMIFCATNAFPVIFSPTLLKLTADPIIQYSFDGSELSIPVQVSGTSAGVIFLVFTKGKAAQMPKTQNGFLGWHHVSKIDTCLYFSTLKGFNTGKNTITWNGKDQDGGTVSPGEYTYYMWAFDNLGAKIMMTHYIKGDPDFDWAYDCRTEIQEVDEKGLPLANPIWYLSNMRWKIGSDPMDETLLETANVPLAEGWEERGDPTMDPKDFNYFYICVKNNSSTSGGIQKFKWVPGGDCEVQTDFGNNGYSDLYKIYDGWSPGPGTASDNVYLYSGDENHVSTTDPKADFYIYDFDGTMVKEVDLTPWWSSPEALAVGGQMNGGPTVFAERNGKVVLNSHASCLVQMVDPKGYLESGDINDFFKWTNGNGDYTLDHNFEDTAKLKWVCNDYNVGVEKYTIAPDANLFVTAGAFDAGAVTFGLVAPDGTGCGYYTFAGDTAGWKEGPMVVQSGTPFDGFYTDNAHTGGRQYERDPSKTEGGIYFIGHDSITGVITSAVGVEEAAPAAFSVAQNSPNPFNPTTSIGFSIAEAGNVSVEVYNVAGQKVDTLADGFMDAGSHSVVWNASGFSAGVYFYTVKTGGFSKTMKMTLLK